LHPAPHSGHLGVVKLLLQRGANVDVALENGEAEVAKFIAEYKADVSIRSNIRSTALDTAQGGADENGTGKEKASLHAAAEEGNVDTVKSLYSMGSRYQQLQCTFRDVRHSRGEGEDRCRALAHRAGAVTPLHRASHPGHLEVSRMLFDHGANVNAGEENLGLRCISKQVLETSRL
jgi:ankyrin repeat protein